jgi:hypothetical protein
MGATIDLDLTIVFIGDLRMNPFKEKINDMINARAGQSDSIFGLMFSNVLFYFNKHNSQFECWIGLKFY